jgi:hypothetical protein
LTVERRSVAAVGGGVLVIDSVLPAAYEYIE